MAPEISEGYLSGWGAWGKEWRYLDADGSMERLNALVLHRDSQPVYLSQGGIYRQDAELELQARYSYDRTLSTHKQAQLHRLEGVDHKVWIYKYSPTVVGSAYDDTIHGLKYSNGSQNNPANIAHEIISGELGDDVIYGYGGNDVLYGDDTLSASIEGGNDALYGGDRNDILNGGYGDDSLDGGNDNDILNGGYGDDSLDGGNGNDTLNGGAGADTFIFNSADGMDLVKDFNAAEGDKIQIDIKAFHDNASNVLGIHNTATNELSLSVAGQAIARFEGINSNADVTSLLEQIDFIGSEGTIDILVSIGDGAGNHTIEGGNQEDVLFGGDGDDVIAGGGYADTLVGGQGADTFVFDTSDHTVDIVKDFNAAEGDKIQIDIKAFQDSTDNARGLSYDIYTNELIVEGKAIAQFEGVGREDIASLFKQIEFIKPQDGSTLENEGRRRGGLLWSNPTDILIGDASDEVLSEDFGQDYIYGGAGNDTIGGGSGSDVLLGGDGNDVITGGVGADTLVGGHGADTFVFEQNAWNTRHLGADEILDFSVSEGDKLLIEASVFGLGSADQINFTQGFSQNEGLGTDVLVAGTKIAHLAGVDVASLAPNSVELF